jgi:hypothetical protein
VKHWFESREEPISSERAACVRVALQDAYGAAAPRKPNKEIDRLLALLRTRRPVS